MAFRFHDFFQPRHQADWVQLTLAVTNFDAVRRPLKCRIRLFEAQGWNRPPKQILAANYVLKRRLNQVKFENLPIGIPLYLHISGDVVSADSDGQGLLSGVEQFLGQRAQVRLVARVSPTTPAQQPQQQRQQQQQQRQQRRQQWSTGPRRFQKMHSLASRQSLVALGEYEATLSALDQRTTKALAALRAHVVGEPKSAVVELGALKELLYDIDDELELLRSSKLDALQLEGLQSGAQLATEKKAAMLRRADELGRTIQEALSNPIFPQDSDEGSVCSGTASSSSGESDASGGEDEDNDDDDAPSIGGGGGGGAAAAAAAAAAPAPAPAKKPKPATDADADAADAKAAVSSDGAGGGGGGDGGAAGAVEAAAAAAAAAEPTPKATLRKKQRQQQQEGGGGAAADADSPEVIPAPAFGKQYSTISQQRLIKLADIRKRVDVIASEYEGLTSLVPTLDASTPEGAAALAKIKNECAQLYGNLEKLQFKEIDSILVGDLTSGQQDARAQRKQLTRDVSDLTEKVHDTVKELQAQLAAARE